MQNISSRNIRKLERLYDLAEKNNIPVDDSCPEILVSMSIRLENGKKIIGLSNVENNEYTKLECMAHEMGHCMTDSFYAGYSPFELRSKHENKANEWAVNEIVPFSELCQAVKNGCRELWQLAEHFEVSHRFMEQAINIHKKNGNVVPQELYADDFDF